jgi:DNA ligase-1
MKITLYKQDKKGRVQQWSVEVEESRHRTIEGLIDGKFTTSEWTQCVGKNIGKKHETSPEQQAILEAESKAKKKREKGFYDNIEDAGKGTNFLEPMLAHKFNDYGDDLVANHEVHSQPKLDGIRCIATREGIFTRNGKEIVATPHLWLSIYMILDENPEVEALDGELYNHQLKHDFNKITSLVKKLNVTPEDLAESATLIQYHVYDMVHPAKTFAERIETLEKYGNYPFVHVVQTLKITDRAHLDEVYAWYLEDGYEGQMVRKSNSIYEKVRTKSLLKRKEFQDEDCEVIDIIEGQGNRSGMAGNVRCIHPNGNTFDANIKGGFEFYKKILIEKELHIGKKATIRYQNLTPDGNPRFPVMVCFRDYE